RGSLKIKSTDPTQHPSMVYNYLSTDQDRREWVEAVRVTREIVSQPAMDPYNSGEISPGPSAQTDEEIRSEEHTSELQSRFDLVCRLLLEKKKKKTDTERKTNNDHTSVNTGQSSYEPQHTS